MQITRVIPSHDGGDICSAPTCRKTEIISPEAATVAGVSRASGGAVWSAPDRTRVTLHPWCGAPDPVDLPPMLRLDTRAELDAYIECVTELTSRIGSADAVREADVAFGASARFSR